MKLIYTSLIINFLLLLETVSSKSTKRSNPGNHHGNSTKNGDDTVDKEKELDLENALKLVNDIERDLQIAKRVAYEIERRHDSSSPQHDSSLTRHNSHHHHKRHHQSRDTKQYHSKDNSARPFLQHRDPIVDGGGSLHNCRYKIEYFYKPIHYMGYKFYQRQSRLVHTCTVL